MKKRHVVVGAFVLAAVGGALSVACSAPVEERTSTDAQRLGALPVSKTAKALGLGPDDALFTVATDGAAMYTSELPRIRARLFEGRMDPTRAEAALARHLDGAGIDNVEELDHKARLRIFHLGYFTWVEQQGVPLDTFEARKSAAWWNELPALVPEWDAEITAFNEDVRRARPA